MDQRPKPRNQSLLEWRIENRYTRPKFLKLLEEQENVKVSLRSLIHWEKKKYRPKDEEVIRAIRRVTKGKVRSESFLGS